MQHLFIGLIVLLIILAFSWFVFTYILWKNRTAELDSMVHKVSKMSSKSEISPEDSHPLGTDYGLVYPDSQSTRIIYDKLSGVKYIEITSKDGFISIIPLRDKFGLYECVPNEDGDCHYNSIW